MASESFSLPACLGLAIAMHVLALTGWGGVGEESTLAQPTQHLETVEVVPFVPVRAAPVPNARGLRSTGNPTQLKSPTNKPALTKSPVGLPRANVTSMSNPTGISKELEEKTKVGSGAGLASQADEGSADEPTAHIDDPAAPGASRSDSTAGHTSGAEDEIHGGSRRSMGNASHSGEAEGAPASPQRGRQGPLLLNASKEPCRGLFPWRASASHGTVRLALRVDASGHATPERIVSEQPQAQGFAAAAKNCVPRLHFLPEADARGRAVDGRAVVALAFERHQP